MAVLALGGSDCEVLRETWLGQPVNSLSSLAYIAAGAYVLRGTADRLGRGPNGPAPEGPGAGKTVGPLSAALPARTSRRGLSAEPVRSGGPPGAAFALVAVGVGSALYHGPMPPGAELIHDGSLVALAAVTLVAWWRGSLGWPPALALAAAATGIAVNALTRTGAPWCRPQSLLQGHAAWHVLTAVAAASWFGSRPGWTSEWLRRSGRRP